jgi:hypothetical protein
MEEVTFCVVDTYPGKGRTYVLCINLGRRERERCFLMDIGTHGQCSLGRKPTQNFIQECVQTDIPVTLRRVDDLRHTLFLST